MAEECIVTVDNVFVTKYTTICCHYPAFCHLLTWLIQSMPSNIFWLIDFLQLFRWKIHTKLLLKGHSKAYQSFVCILFFEYISVINPCQQMSLVASVFVSFNAGQKPTVSYFSCWVRWNIPKCGYRIKFLKSLTAVLNILRFCGDLTGLFSVIMFAFC